MMDYAFEAWAEANLDVRKNNGSEWLVMCPSPDHEARNPHAYFNVEKGVGVCFSCHYTWSLTGKDSNIEYTALSKYIRSRITNFIKEDDKDDVKLPDTMLQRYNFPCKYWEEERFINPDTQKLFNLGYDPISDAVTIPMRDIYGNLLGVTRRFISKDFEGSNRYRYPKEVKTSQNVFASWLHNDYDMRTVYIFEGAIDAMRLWQLGYPAIGLYGSNFSPAQLQLILRMGVERAILFGDSDESGMQARKHILGFWEKSDGSYKYRKDTDLSKYCRIDQVTNHQGKKDAGSMTDEEIIKSIESVKHYPRRIYAIKKNDPSFETVRARTKISTYSILK